MEGLQIDVKNFSKIEWSRNNWHVGAGVTEGLNWTDELSATPSETIMSKIGATTAAAASVHLDWIVKDALWMVLGYGSGEGSFAVMIQQLFHMFGQGPQCQWQHWDKTWSDRTTDTSQYVWTFNSTIVTATPTLTNSGGSVLIVIKDKA